MEIAAWGQNVYVKIPITNTRAEPAYDLAGRLSHAGVRLNITAIMTLEQVRGVLLKLSPKTSSYISIFAGRIADTGTGSPAADGRRCGAAEDRAVVGADLGKPSGASQHLPRGGNRVPHHHGDERHI